MSKFKRVLCLLLTVIMLVGMMPLGVNAATFGIYVYVADATSINFTGSWTNANNGWYYVNVTASINKT